MTLRPFAGLALALGAASACAPVRSSASAHDREDFGAATADDPRERVVAVTLAQSGVATLDDATGASVTERLLPWRPSYTLALTSRGAALECRASVDNPTRRDWAGVALTLRFDAVGLRLGDAHAQGQALDQNQDRDRDGVPDQQDSCPDAPGSLERDRVLGEVPRGCPPNGVGPAEHGDPFVVTSLKLAAPVTIPRGASSHVRLADEPLVGVEGVLVGRAPGDEALGERVVRVPNRLAVPLPRGPVSVFRDGAFVGGAALETTPLAASALVRLGDEPAVRVTRSRVATTRPARLVRAMNGAVFVDDVKIATTTYRVSGSSAALAGRPVWLRHERTPGHFTVQAPPVAETSVNAELLVLEPRSNTGSGARGPGGEAYPSPSAPSVASVPSVPSVPSAAGDVVAAAAVVERMPVRRQVELVALSPGELAGYLEVSSPPKAVAQAMRDAVDAEHAARLADDAGEAAKGAELHARARRAAARVEFDGSASALDAAGATLPAP